MTITSATHVEWPSPRSPTRHAMTVGEFFGMGEAGVLSPDARCELIEGEIIDIPPIGPLQASKTNRLAALFNYGDTLPFTPFPSLLPLGACLGSHGSSYPASPIM